MTRSESYAYIAGIIDGEGCIRIETFKIPKIYRNPTNEWRDYFRPTIEVWMTNEKAVKFIHSLFGGSYFISDYHVRKRIGRRLFIWRTTGRKIMRVLIALLPYLKVKKRQAKIAIKMASCIFPKGKVRMPPRVFIKNMEKKRELYYRMKKLNHPE